MFERGARGGRALAAARARTFKMVTFASGTPWRLSSSSTPVRSAEMTASFHSVWITPMRKADVAEDISERVRSRSIVPPSSILY